MEYAVFDLDHCATAEAADAVLSACLRRKQECSYSLERIEFKAQLLAASAGASLVALVAGSPRLFVASGAAYALAMVAFGATTLCAGGALRILDTRSSHDVSALFDRDALTLTDPGEARRQYALLLSIGTVNQSAAIRATVDARARWVVRAQASAAAGVVFAVFAAVLLRFGW